MTEKRREKMRICVIGGTGHIGKNLVKMLLEEKF
jgi:uncharacterized protein YbjT (DUF2867 family)